MFAKAMRMIVLTLLALLGAAPSVAQDLDRETGDLIRRDQSNPSAHEDIGQMMDWALPFKDGQMLRYFDDKGEFAGYARRNRLTIRFYESDGRYLGRAERVSQAATIYYAADGEYLGRRLHKKQTDKSRVDKRNPSMRGFHFPHLEPRNQE